MQREVQQKEKAYVDKKQMTNQELNQEVNYQNNHIGTEDETWSFVNPE